MSGYEFRRTDGYWERRTGPNEPWCRLRVETHTEHRRVLRNIGEGGRRYYRDVEDVIKVWIWEPLC